MWGKASCLSKQHDGRNDQPSDLKSNALIPTIPPRPHVIRCCQQQSFPGLHSPGMVILNLLDFNLSIHYFSLRLTQIC